MKWIDSLKNTDMQAILGIVGEKRFQEKIDTVVSGIEKNSLVIAKKYGELMAAARKDFDVAEKTLVAKIVTSMYNKTKEIRKRIKKDGITLNDVPARIDINIERWKELKVYGRMLNLNKYGISLATKLNESLKKYHLDGTIKAYYDVPYFSGYGQMFITFQVTDPQELTI
jgi:hypothetical protein